MAKTGRKERSMALYETILKLSSPEECCKFFEDLSFFLTLFYYFAQKNQGGVFVFRMYCC